MAVEIHTYLNGEVTQELMDEYFRVERANVDWRVGEDDKKIHDDQFEPSRKELKGLVIALDKEKVIGGLRLFLRQCESNGDKYVLGGIGGVFTANDYKRQGVATMMLSRSMIALKELNADVAYLCTDIEKLEKLYWPFGFRHFEVGFAYLGKSGASYLEDEGMLAMVNSLDIFQQLMASKDPIDIGVGNW